MLKSKTLLKESWKKITVFAVIFSFLTLGLFAFANPSEAKVPEASQKGMILNKPGVVFISTYYEITLIVQSSAGYPELSGKSYKAETGGTGSGFVISPDGYIVTNGHVVNTPDEQLAWQAISAASSQILNDIVVIEFTKAAGYPPSQAEINQMIPLVEQQLGGKNQLVLNFFQAYKAGEIKMDEVDRNVYIQIGTTLSGKKIPIDKGHKAEVKEVDFDGFTDDGEVKGKDIALLKIAANNLPTVTLGNSDNVEVGDRVYVVGYPGAATFQEFLSSESTLEPSLTSGVISAKKTAKDGTPILQTDAALTHGNSGGPAFAESGEVIGIASMVAIEQGQQKYGFSYLRPINLAKEFIGGSVNVQPGPTTEAYKKGLELFWEEHYSAAIDEFETALRLHPGLLDAQDYITKSQEAISRGEDIAVSGQWFKDYWWVLLIIVGGVVVVVIIIIVLVVLMGKKKKPSAPAAPQNPPTQPPQTPPAPPKQ